MLRPVRKLFRTVHSDALSARASASWRSDTETERSSRVSVSMTMLVSYRTLARVTTFFYVLELGETMGLVIYRMDDR